MTLTIDDISKSFCKRPVLLNLNHTFASGCIHALVGDNGAGKSTLAAILSGAQKPDSGRILCDGQAVSFDSVKDATDRGIVCVKQRPPLADWLSVMQNITLPWPSSSVKRARQLLDTLEALHFKWCPSLPLHTLADELTAAQRFYTALLRALLLTPSFLILDEPTALLGEDECTALYKHMREAARNGVTCLVITHHQGELKYCDTVTPISSPSPSTPAPMSGSSSAVAFPLSRRCIETTKAVPNHQLEVTPTVAAAPGLVTLVRGSTASLHSMEIEVLNASHKWRKRGAAIIPTDRVYRASHPSLDAATVLCALRPGAVDTAYAAALIKRAGVDTVPSALCSSLSGGMLQRLIMARELDLLPPVVLAFNPLQGLDRASQQRSIAALRQAAMAGSAVVVASSALFPAEEADRVVTL